MKQSRFQLKSKLQYVTLPHALLVSTDLSFTPTHESLRKTCTTIFFTFQGLFHVIWDAANSAPREDQGAVVGVCNIRRQQSKQLAVSPELGSPENQALYIVSCYP